MCTLCKNSECENGEMCGLAPYVAIPAVNAAIKRVQGIDSGFEAYGFGEQRYEGETTRPAPVTAVWSYIRRRAARCPYCKRSSITVWHIDHKMPWNAYLHQMLGLNADAPLSMPLFIARVLGSDPNNLEPLCSSCNESKGDRIPGTPEFETWKRTREAWGRTQTGAPRRGMRLLDSDLARFVPRRRLSSDDED